MASDLRRESVGHRRRPEPHSSRPEAGHSLRLSDSVQYLRGVGPARAKEFASLGVSTVADLVEYFPFRHEVIPKSQAIGTLKLDSVATVVGELRRVRQREAKSGTTILADIVDGTGMCGARWFNSEFLAGKLHNGLVVRASGTVSLYAQRASFTNPRIEPIEDPTTAFSNDTDVFVPVYSATARLPSPMIAAIIEPVLKSVGDSIKEFLPPALRSRRQLPQRGAAILKFHHPKRTEEIEIARRRLAYDEWLLCRLAVQSARHRVQSLTATASIRVTDEIDRRIRARLPFALTSAQDAAVEDIRRDLAQKHPMNRLLQADVGAGKTAVALYAALAAVAYKKQVAVLAPTEVVALQLRDKFAEYLKGSRVRIGLLQGATRRAERSQLLAELTKGELDLIVGTHALLETDVRFADLGLVIIDEQHKFGVEQRALLRTKGRAPHVLVLTATPIPRTLALTAFGDLDVTAMTGVLPGRHEVATRLVRQHAHAEAWSFVKSRIQANEQAYIVYPLIDESESLPLKAAAAEFELLRETALAGIPMELLHGRMTSPQKAEVMGRFRAGACKALVTTTVIEVGVDVPAATIMVIQNADRYGLSQLHQLRGRVGRSSKKSYCLLMTDHQRGAPAERLEFFCRTHDGFRIAEEDLRLRGPGELLGKRQHGLPAFRVADWTKDLELLEQAKADAAQLLESDPQLAKPENVNLRNFLTQKYPGALSKVSFFNVG